MKLRSVPWKALVAVVAVAIFYSELVMEFAPDEVWGWFSTLLATFLSALLALAVGLWLFNKQTHMTDRQRKQWLTEVLDTEIEDIRNVLSETDLGAWIWIITSDSSFKQVMLADFELISMDEAVRSGLFPQDVTRELINLVGGIRMFNTRVRNARALLQAEQTHNVQGGDEYQGLLSNTNVRFLDEGRQWVIEHCEQMLNHLHG